MLSTLLAVALAAALCGPADTPVPVAPDTVAALWADGESFADFLEAAKRRRDTWHGNYAKGIADPAIVARARAIPGRWRFLVVAEDWCGDSANTIPYFASLVDAVPGFEIRIVRSEPGDLILDRHRSVDGRKSTPTVVLLTDGMEQAGCWVERPKPLQDWFQEQKPKMNNEDLHAEKYKWYDQDAGRTTLEELVALAEAAARGARPTACAGGG